MLLKCCNLPVNLENLAMAIQLEKVSFHSNPKEEQCQKCLNYCTRAFISHASKVKFIILQARLQQYLNWELPDVQVGFRKGRRTRDQIANIQLGHGESQGILENIYCFIDCPKPFDCVDVDHDKLWKIL